MLTWSRAFDKVIYISGDTVWYEGVAAVAERFPVGLAVLFMGSARIAAVGPSHLTMTADDALQAARAFSQAPIIPLHFEGWTHFSESHQDINRAFVGAGLESRVRWLVPGRRTSLLLA